MASTPGPARSWHSVTATARSSWPTSKLSSASPTGAPAAEGSSQNKSTSCRCCAPAVADSARALRPPGSHTADRLRIGVDEFQIECLQQPCDDDLHFEVGEVHAEAAMH